MEKFDVVIVGAGPAGLKAAEILAKNNRKVLVLEKNKVIGPKVCAAGITEKDLTYIPKKLIERTFTSFLMVKNSKIRVKHKLYIVEREKLGQYQLKQAKKAGAVIKTNCFVKKINKNSVIVNNKEYSFNYLIGADGSSSIVRNYIGLKSKVIALAVQYKLDQPMKDLELHFNPQLFYSWYAWVFPHKNYSYIGTGILTSLKQSKNLRKKLDEFTKQQNLDTKNAEFEAALINADYQGFKFNNTFLVGDAAGLANPFTGEGIYQALVSGEEISKKIINPNYKSNKLKIIISKNKKLIKWLFIFNNSPYLLRMFYWLGFKLMNYKSIQNGFIKLLLDY
jgi:geranylgeranyl reductase